MLHRERIVGSQTRSFRRRTVPDSLRDDSEPGSPESSDASSQTAADSTALQAKMSNFLKYYALP